jgi:hypothetical protein
VVRKTGVGWHRAGAYCACGAGTELQMKPTVLWLYTCKFHIYPMGISQKRRKNHFCIYEPSFVSWRGRVYNFVEIISNK